MRNVKEHDERRNEIIDTASRLFVQKGYDQCSVNDILTAIGIAKGTFYYYFKSKEEVLDAVIGKVTDLIEERVKAVATNTALSPRERLLQVFLAMRVDSQIDNGLLEEMHRPENALLHQKSLVASVEAIVPLLSKIVEDGVSSGEFKCDYPKQYMRIFLTSTLTLMDDGIFESAAEEQQGLFIALLSVLEYMLGQEKGSIQSMVADYWSF